MNIVQAELTAQEPAKTPCHEAATRLRLELIAGNTGIALAAGWDAHDD